MAVVTVAQGTFSHEYSGEGTSHVKRLLAVPPILDDDDDDDDDDDEFNCCFVMFVRMFIYSGHFPSNA